MARRGVKVQSSTLQDLADEYIEAKAKETEAGKITKKLGPEIKKLMKEDSLESFDASEGRLVLSVRVSESFDEESLIEYLKSLGKENGIVKTKEYIDYDVLESAIYNERLSVEEVQKMDDYKIVKQTEVLTVKR